MKIIYCIHAVSNSGGMERILQQKVNYLADVIGYEVVVVTTEQNGKPPFFYFSPKIRFIDLHVNYGDVSTDKEKNVFWKVVWKTLHKPIHKARLKKVLMQEKADIVVTLFNNDIGFIPSIKDGSKKISEFHFSYSYKSIAARNRIVRIVQCLRCKIWKKDFSRFDHFVVLTEEDRDAWGRMPNIEVIPNFIPALPHVCSSMQCKRVLAIGRLTYQKGFDLLIKAWKIVAKQYPEWHLDIYGNGSKAEIEELENMLNVLQLSKEVSLHSATKDIEKEYINSSLFVLSSRYEGLPMVLLEAMSYGLPIVAFQCPCGPKDIIRDTYGSLVKNGDIQELADAIIKWLADEGKRRIASDNARMAAEKYTQERVMKKWIDIFNS